MPTTHSEMPWERQYSEEGDFSFEPIALRLF